MGWKPRWIKVLFVVHLEYNGNKGLAMLTGKVQARMDPALKESAERVFEKLGMTTTEAVRLFFKQVELYQGLPFSVNVPNKATIKALRDADENRQMSRYKNFGELLGEINA